MVFTHCGRMQLKERVRLLFGGMPRRVQVAALPWRRNNKGEIEVLLVTSRGTGRWVLPKGWPEDDEQPFEAATREAMEEAGIRGDISSAPLGKYYYQKKLPTGMEWRCEVAVYPLEVDDIADKWPERKKRQRRWFAPKDAARLVDEPDLGELISSFSGNPRQTAA
ncbi:NUDIX hydrolase [Aquamicrobium zhengzhouense]|uniref:NUDIX hydrolase n=1 Tax=Aquamicrobium zhengzhouense TaxID=2781738 RepID=A0ABS0SBJ7_9HYPH|nr:NUDIX hydrolase [Aquamicrobium zhengzhouense]MBI1620674.1 NUDIX hydrolase [Aquamicrobium zhengzhouense]